MYVFWIITKTIPNQANTDYHLAINLVRLVCLLLLLLVLLCKI